MPRLHAVNFPNNPDTWGVTMYNEAFKLKMFQPVLGQTDSVNQLTLVMDRLSAGEEMLQKDVAFMGPQELQIAVSMAADQCGINPENIRKLKIWYRRYIQFCVQNSIPGVTDHSKSIDFFKWADMASHAYKDPQDLSRALDGAFPPAREETVHNLYRCAFWLLYMGLRTDDITKVRKQDVDFVNMRVSFEDSYYRIYEESVEAFRVARDCPEFTLYHKISIPKGSYTTRVKRIESPMLFVGARCELNKRVLMGAVNDALADAYNRGLIDKQVPTWDTWRSGWFYRLYRDELKQFQPDFRAMIMAQGRAMSHVYKDTVRAYANTYKAWKEAFGWRT